MPAYPVSYRDEIVETQGRLFGRVGREHPDADSLDFMESYLRGRTRGFIDRAEALVSNMDSAELLAFFLETDGYVFKPGHPVPGLAADWTGQFYAWAQWQSGLSSRNLIERIPLSTILDAYPGLHDLSLPLAVERCLSTNTPSVPTERNEP